MATLSVSYAMSTPMGPVGSATPQTLPHQQLVTDDEMSSCQDAGFGPAGAERLPSDTFDRPNSSLFIIDQEDAVAEAGGASKESIQLATVQAMPLVAGKNNSSSDHHHKYICPSFPDPPDPIGDPVHVLMRSECRMCLRPDRNKYVTLNFRVMRRDSEMHVGQIVNLCGIRRNALYTPSILDRWTRTLRIKIRASIKIALVFSSVSARLGLRGTVGLKYCLDGFYGIEAFGDAFGNYGPGICPWMEVTGDASPISLKLQDNDNIYISIATEKMYELVHQRVEQFSEQAFKKNAERSESLRQSKVSFSTAHSENRYEQDPKPRESFLPEEPVDLEL